MILNATLLRLDPPAPAAQGPDVLIRCALATQTVRQDRRSRDLGQAVTHVAYVPLAKVPPAGPVVNGRVRLRADGSTAAATYRIVEVVEHAGTTLAHVEVSLEKV
jgi:hypothetical protein